MSKLNLTSLKNLLLSVFFFFNAISFGQNIKIVGKSYKPFKYKVVVSNSFDEKYYNGNTIHDSASVKNGKLNFTIPNQTSDIPYAYMLVDKIDPRSFYQSNTFFINSVSKNITIGKENDPENFEVTTDNDLIKKEVLKFQNYFAAFNSEKESFHKKSREEYEKIENKDKIPQAFWDNYEILEKKYSTREDSILFSFVKINPDSFVALWKLVEKFQRTGYKPIYQETFNGLSSHLKTKRTAETLRLAIKQASIFQVGKKFPISKIKNIANKKDFSLPAAKYTLVDFWFSHCKPCLEQMPNYTQLYSEFNTKGFEIVGIATDRKAAYANLESTVEKFKIPWENYWDENGKQSSDWTITSFPTNFLLNEKGEILFKNISEKELKELLNDKL